MRGKTKKRKDNLNRAVRVNNNIWINWETGTQIFFKKDELI
jgi:hypothetical protein